MEWLHRLPRNYWLDKINCKKFLEKLATENNYQHPTDWTKAKAQFLIQNKGRSLLAKYKGSVFNMLRDIYPG